MTTPPCPRCGYPDTDHPSFSHRADDHPSDTPAPVLLLVDTETAAFAAGREVKVIYRWANQGRLTRHGERAKGKARWNLREIPPWDGPASGKPQPPPPPVQAKNFQDTSLT